MAPGLGVHGVLDVLGHVGIGVGGGGEVALAIDLAPLLALLLGNRGRGASGFFGSETDTEPETA